jgi:hypothetical protein
MFDGRSLRIGSYGDPAAVPFYVWAMLLGVVKNWTGYTHQWHTDIDNRFKNIVMASVDNDVEKTDANNAGWRTFRVTPVNATSYAKNEIGCPAAEENGKKTTCENCGLCSGMKFGRNKNVKNVAIVAHGRSKKRFSGGKIRKKELTMI